MISADVIPQFSILLFRFGLPVWYCSYYRFFFFKQKTAYEMRISDWSSDMCSSDLVHAAILGLPRVQRRAADAVLATHIGGLHPAFLLAQHRDDLLLAEPGLPHVRLLTKADSSSNWQSFRGARQLRLW